MRCSQALTTSGKAAAGAAKALAAISGCTAAISTPCAEDLCIAHYEVVQVGRSAAAVLAVTTAGYVRTRVARVRTVFPARMRQHLPHCSTATLPL